MGVAAEGVLIATDLCRRCNAEMRAVRGVARLRLPAHRRWKMEVAELRRHLLVPATESVFPGDWRKKRFGDHLPSMPLLRVARAAT